MLRFLLAMSPYVISVFYGAVVGVFSGSITAGVVIGLIVLALLLFLRGL